MEPDDAREMDESEDPFGVRLEWPEELLGAPMDRPATTDAPAAATSAVTTTAEPSAREETSWAPPSPAAPAPAASQPAAAAPLPVVTVPVLSDESREVLAGVVARVEALTAATVTFRNLVSERVSEYTERVIQATATAAAEADEQRRMNDRALADIRSGLARTSAAVERLTATVEGLPAELDRVAAELGAQLDRVTDEVQTLRRRTAVRPRATARGDLGEDDTPPPRRPPRKRSN